MCVCTYVQSDSLVEETLAPSGGFAFYTLVEGGVNSLSEGCEESIRMLEAFCKHICDFVH